MSGANISQQQTISKIITKTQIAGSQNTASTVTLGNVGGDIGLTGQDFTNVANSIDGLINATDTNLSQVQVATINAGVAGLGVASNLETQVLGSLNQSSLNTITNVAGAAVQLIQNAGNNAVQNEAIGGSATGAVAPGESSIFSSTTPAGTIPTDSTDSFANVVTIIAGGIAILYFLSTGKA